MSIFPPLVKVTISHYGKKSLFEESLNTSEVDVSMFIDSEFGAEVEYKRAGFSSVMVSTSFPQRFYKNAFKLIYSLYEQYGLYAYARLNIYRRDKVDVTKYYHLKTMELDFKTLVKYDDFVELECTSVSLNSYIKSGGTTKYDIPVSELSPNYLTYDRIDVINSVDILPIFGTKVIVSARYDRFNFFPIQISNYTGVKGGKISFNETSGNVDERGGGEIPTLYESGILNENVTFATINDTVELKISYNFKLFVQKVYPNNEFTISLSLGTREYYNGSAVLSRFKTYRIPVGTPIEIKDEIVQTFTKGQELVFYTTGRLDNTSIFTAEYPSLTVEEFNEFKISYLDRGDSLNIQMASPQDMLNRIIKNMTNNDSRYSGRIEFSDTETTHDIYMIAAESVRNLEKANFHTSFREFTDWMNTLCYSYEFADDYTLVFKKIDKFYNDNVVLSLNEKENAGLIVSADTEHAYTHILAGYERKEYNDNVNGRFEVNGTFEYRTGLVTESDNELKLISPYRADIIGLELLCWERPEDGSELTDTKSDNDIFLVSTKTVYTSVGGINIIEVKLYDSVNYNVDKGATTLYNVLLGPRQIIENNKKRIGIITDKIQFASTTSNRNTVIQGGATNLYEDVVTPEGYFKPQIYDIACGYKTNLPIIESPNGIVEFIYKGVKYQGYIKEATKNYTKETETTIQIYAK